jgi:predicted ABC-type ATPase
MSGKKYKKSLKTWENIIRHGSNGSNSAKRYTRQYKPYSKSPTPSTIAGLNSDWVDPLGVYDACTVSKKEYDDAIIFAKNKILKGKKPQNTDLKPKFYVTIGAPGSGKSTLINHIAKKFNPELDFVSIDLDLAVEFHPRYRNLWSAESAVNNGNANIGYTLTRQICNDNLEGMMESIFYDIIQSNTRHNIILQTQDLNSIILARSVGYEVNLAFIGVKLETAIRRSKLRAITTGKFLAPNIHMQNQIVEEMWNDYKYNTSWYSLWTDNVFIIDNNKDVNMENEDIMKIIKIKKFNYYDYTHSKDEKDNRSKYVDTIQKSVDSILEAD